jgi:hypothetical protein
MPLLRSLTTPRLVSYNELEKSYPDDKGLLGEEKASEWGTFFARNIKAIHRVNYHRIVFDEGHLIKNSKTKGFRAAMALKAKKRWVLTGTPIIDATEEAFSYCRLLRIRHTGTLKTFRQNYCDPNNHTHPLRLTEALRPYVFDAPTRTRCLVPASSISPKPSTTSCLAKQRTSNALSTLHLSRSTLSWSKIRVQSLERMDSF